MIYTVTLNPSLDYIIYVENYREGKVNRSTATELVPGGKGINVSLMLKNLGIESIATGFVGGFVGDEIERALTKRGIKTDFVHISGNSRINVKLKADNETEINASGPQIDVTALYEKLGALKEGDFLVLAGSASGASVYADIMARLPEGVKVIVDAEGELLENALEYSPFLIKPNHHELGAMFERVVDTAAEAATCAAILRERGAQNVFVSMAGDGGVLVSESGVCVCPAPKGEVVNSTGAGDSAVAGFIAGFVESGDVEHAFVKGICAGSASAFSKGFASPDEIDRLLCELEKREL